MASGKEGTVQECEDYVEKHGIQTILKECIAKLCQERPDNPYKYLREYFEKLEKVCQSPHTPLVLCALSSLATTVYLQLHTYHTRLNMSSPLCIYTPSLLSLQEQAPDVLDTPPVAVSRGRRMAVSASVMTEEQATSYIKKVCARDDNIGYRAASV